MRLPDRDIFLIVGKTGMGKTEWARRALSGRRRVIIIDPMEEYHGVLFTRLDELIDYVRWHRIFRVRYNPLPEDFSPLCEIARAAGQGTGGRLPGCTLVIEEAPRYLPARAELPSEFVDLIYRGRHYNVSLFIVSQRAGQLHIALKSQWTRLVSFRQTARSDVDFISNELGDNFEEIRGYEKLQFLDATPDGLTRKQLTFDNRKEIVIESVSAVDA